MKIIKLLVAVLTIFVFVQILYAFEIFETFDTNPASRWQQNLEFGSGTTFNWITEGSGGHLQPHFKRDGISARYSRPLPSSVTISQSNPGTKMYFEVDMQLSKGILLYGNGRCGLGKSDANNMTNLAYGDLYWRYGPARYMVGFYGDAGISSKQEIDITGHTISPGDCVRLRYEIGYDDVNDVVYSKGGVFNIKADGSTGLQIYSASLGQNPTDPNRVESLTMDVMGFFSTDAAADAAAFLDADIDNFYVSDTGFNASPVLPSWRQFSSGTQLLDTFSSNPSANWTFDADSGARSQYEWVEIHSGGYMDVILWREAIRSNYTRPIGARFELNSLENKLGWYFQFDTRFVDFSYQAHGMIGTLDSQAWPPTIWNDLDAAYVYPYGAGSEGIRVALNGYDDYGYTSSSPAFPAMGLVFDKSYRIKCAVAYEGMPVIVGKVYKINPDGSDGDQIIGDSYTRNFGRVTSPIYADVIGFYSSLASSNNNSCEFYIDNFYVSDTGFPLENQIPTWDLPPQCNELPEPMIGDFGGPGGEGTGNYDCVIDIYDLKILAEHWLRIPE